MVRSLLTPQSKEIQISIPDSYVGKKVEVIVFACDEPEVTTEKVTNVMAQFWGVISEDTTEAMHQHVAESRMEWGRDI